MVSFCRSALPKSGLAKLFEADLGFWFGALNVAARGQTLVPKHPQGFYFRPLPGTLAVLQNFEIPGAGHATFVSGGALFFGLGAPQNQQFADVLDGCRIEFFGQRLKHRFAGSAVI